jgi:Holliday junction resolvasome RuvABC endonuclease subunit
VRILGLDPGKRNAFWVLAMPVGGRFLDVIDTGQIDTVPDMQVHDKLICIRRELRTLLDSIAVDMIYAERFVARPGMLRGNAAETVNLMLGILWAECCQRHIRLRLIMPSVHKGWIKKNYHGRTAQQVFKALNEHQADALALATYGWYHYRHVD